MFGFYLSIFIYWLEQGHLYLAPLGRKYLMLVNGQYSAWLEERFMGSFLINSNIGKNSLCFLKWQESNIKIKSVWALEGFKSLFWSFYLSHSYYVNIYM